MPLDVWFVYQFKMNINRVLDVFRCNGVILESFLG